MFVFVFSLYPSSIFSTVLSSETRVFSSSYYRVRTTRQDVCGRDRTTMCPRDVRHTEWVRQTRNIIMSAA